MPDTFIKADLTADHAPYNAAAVPTSLIAPDSYSQDEVEIYLHEPNTNQLATGLTAREKFLASPVSELRLSYLGRLFQNGQASHFRAMQLLTKRRTLHVDDEFIVPSNHPNLCFHIREHYLDHALVLGNRIGLDVILPNERSNHAWTASLSFANTRQLWPESEGKHLPFSPDGRMMFIGNRGQEQVWIAMAPVEMIDGDDSIDLREVASTLQPTSALKTEHQCHLMIFFGYLFAKMNLDDFAFPGEYADLEERYPHPCTHAAVRRVTSILYASFLPFY